MTTNDTKPASASTTVWAGLFTMVAALAPSFLQTMGVVGGAEQQATIEAAAQLAAAVGGAIAVYGRLRARRRIA